jgi:hypothetical protein
VEYFISHLKRQQSRVDLLSACRGNLSPHNRNSDQYGAHGANIDYLPPRCLNMAERSLVQIKEMSRVTLLPPLLGLGRRTNKVSGDRSIGMGPGALGSVFNGDCLRITTRVYFWPLPPPLVSLTVGLSTSHTCSTVPSLSTGRILHTFAITGDTHEFIKPSPKTPAL